VFFQVSLVSASAMLSKEVFRGLYHQPCRTAQFKLQSWNDLKGVVGLHNMSTIIHNKAGKTTASKSICYKPLSPRQVQVYIQWNSVNKSTSGQPVLDLIRGGFNNRGVGKFCSKQFGCNKRLDLLAVGVLNGFYCNAILKCIIKKLIIFKTSTKIKTNYHQLIG